MLLKVILLSASILAGILGIFVYSKNRNDLVNRAFSASSLLFGSWILTNLLSGFYNSPFISRLTYAVGSLVPIGTLILACRLTGF
ncbi:MAG: hypothetical protein PHG69_05335, partial [Candidatus Omnitrophica bacterium]|nr:hypothetical protein [Candidatus Omnitrophota bacterium]